MEEKSNINITNFLNEPQYLKRYQEIPCPFTETIQKRVKPMNAKHILKGNFWNFDKQTNKFQNFYFELYPNILMRYPDKNKNGQGEYILIQFFNLFNEMEKFGDTSCYSIILEADEGLVKLICDKQNIFQQWQQEIQRFCKLNNFLQRYKVENRIYEHFYRCIDKRKKTYAMAKIISRKGSKAVEQKKFVENEITIIRKVQCALLPQLKKVYEDDNYMYLTFQFFRGDDLLKISANSRLEEIAVATLAYHILKGLKTLHTQGYYHGNLKLENIVFSTSKKDNEIFIINFKYTEDRTEQYREKLIKKGNNFYVAPEVLENKPFNQQIDLFSLGVCLFFMVFKQSPYTSIEKDQYGNGYSYKLDLSLLEKMKSEKKKDANSKQPLSASGIDFFLNLLQIDPNKRPSAAQSMNHSWFINFTNKQGNKKKNPKQNMGMEQDAISLRTIIESSEISEKEIDARFGSSKQIMSGKSKILTNIFNQDDSDNIYEELNEDDDNLDELDGICDDEANGLEQKLKNLDLQTQQKFPLKQQYRDHSDSGNFQQLQTDTCYSTGTQSIKNINQSFQSQTQKLDDNSMQQDSYQENLLQQADQISKYSQKNDY